MNQRKKEPFVCKMLKLLHFCNLLPYPTRFPWVLDEVGRTTHLHTQAPPGSFLSLLSFPPDHKSHSLTSCSQLGGKNKTQIFDADYCANDQKFSNPSRAICTCKIAAGFKNWELPRDLILQNVAHLYDTLLLYKHLKWCSHTRFKYISQCLDILNLKKKTSYKTIEF